MNTTEKPSFGALLRHRRHAAGLTQEELAERAELSVRELAYLERDRHAPRPGTIRRLGEALGLSEEDHATLLAAVQEEVPDGPVAARVSIPVPPTSFIGREREVAAIADLVRAEHIHLLTLTGPGGTGKTRLAIQAAHALGDTFPDGVVFVSLASIADPTLVASTIAASLAVQESPGQSLVEALHAALREKRLLLLLDNFEHLLPAASLVSELLTACPRLTVLATSRSVLHLAAEHTYAVPPLAVPDPGRLPPLGTLIQYDAVALFLERARAAKAGFALTDKNAPAVVEICARLDGLPLTIELAAARIRLFPPQALLARLESRLKVLTEGPRDVPGRHQTLRSTIDWSYSLLTAEEQALFARLSVFAGGWTIEAAELIGSPDGDPPLDVLAGMASLVEKSLVQQEGEDELRFRMLETIREYAWERLAESGEEADTRKRHAYFFLSMAEDAERVHGANDEVRTLQRLDVDHDNLRAALAWCTDEPDMGGIALRLAASLGWFWKERAHWNEGHRWLERVLALPAAGESSRARALALSSLAHLEWSRGNHAVARANAEESVALWRSLDDLRGLAGAIDILGGLCQRDGDHSEARELFVEAVELWRRLGNPRGTAWTLVNLGVLELQRGNVPAARARLNEILAMNRISLSAIERFHVLRMLAGIAWFESDGVAAERYEDEALSMARSLEGLPDVQSALGWLGWTIAARGDYDRGSAVLEQSLALARQLRQDEGAMAISWMLNHLGDIARGRGDSVQAAALYQESLALFRAQGHQQGEAAVIHNLGQLALTRGDLEQARTLFAESLRLFHSIGFLWSVGDCLAALAGVASHEGRPARSATLFGAAEAIHASVDSSGVFVQRVNEAAWERDIALGRSQTDEATWERAWSAGQAMSPDEAVTLALR